MSESQILNLDELTQEPRLIQLTEKGTGIKREINVTDIPSGVILELVKKESDLKKKVDLAEDPLFDWMLDVAIKICKPSFPEITIDWIVENMNFNQLQKFLQFVLKPLDNYIKEATEEAKKQMAAKATTRTSSVRPRSKNK